MWEYNYGFIYRVFFIKTCPSHIFPLFHYIFRKNPFEVLLILIMYIWIMFETKQKLLISEILIGSCESNTVLLIFLYCNWEFSQNLAIIGCIELVNRFIFLSSEWINFFFQSYLDSTALANLANVVFQCPIKMVILLPSLILLGRGTMCVSVVTCKV